ncbi:hypothetical protein [Arthrobacter sp. YN]|uniref:hypothetical protein n=1 Tax=Arthrobacter sp. YN TaxID=2020486 RepID=UPI0012FE5028|nr:hypothetical protein [Arthrobacter sp. YN]
MSRPHRVLAGPMAVGLAIALLTGCSSSPPAGTSTSSATTSSANTEEVCTAAAAHNTALTNFRNLLTPEVTIDQLRTARDEVIRTYAVLEKKAESIAADRVAALKAAQRKLEAAVNDVRDQATVPEAVASLKDEAAAVETALSDLNKDVKC